jgi:hypothetical protein
MFRLALINYTPFRPNLEGEMERRCRRRGYQEWRLILNFYCPSVKLIHKERIGSKTIKHHDNPKTPRQRILESPFIPQQIKTTLAKQLENLNPFVLRKAIEDKLKLIFDTCLYLFPIDNIRSSLPKHPLNP